MAEKVTFDIEVDGARATVRELDKVEGAIRDVDRRLGEMDRQADTAADSMRDLSRDGARQFDRLAADVNQSTGRMGRSLRGIGDDADKATRDLRDFATDAERAARRASNALDDLDGPMMGGAGAGGGFGAGRAAGIGLAGGALAIAGAAADAAGFDQVVTDIFAPLSDRAVVEAAAVRLGIEEAVALDLIEQVEQARPNLSRTDIAEALVSASENLPTARVSQLLEVVDTLAQFDAAGFGDTQQLGVAAANLSAAFGTSGGEALNIIAASIQQGANRQGDFLDVLVEYSRNAADIGLTLDEFATTLVRGSDPSVGLFNLDKVGDAQRELGNQIRSGSEEVSAALDDLGLNADRVRAQFASGEGGDAFRQIVDGLQERIGTARGQEIATTLFGAPFEDLGSELFTVLDITESRLNAIEGAAQGAADAISGGVFGGLQSTLRTGRNNLTGGQDLGYDPLGINTTPLGQRPLAPFTNSPFTGFSPGPSGLPNLSGLGVPARPTRTEIRSDVNINVNVTGGILDSASVRSQLLRQLAPELTRIIDRQVQSARVFGGSGRQYGGV